MIVYVSRKHPPSIGGMQRLSQQLLAELRFRLDVVPIVHDCPRYLLVPFILWVFVRLSWVLTTCRARVQVVHFGDPLTALAAPLCRIWRVPTVVTVHGLDISYHNWLYQRLLEFSVGQVNALACISRAAREVCIKHGLPLERCVVITPGVAPALDGKARNPREELGRRLGRNLNDCFLLITVGRLIERKGVAWLVESVMPGLVSEIPSLLYLVVGDGPDRSRIERAADSAAVREHVLLAGRVDEETLALCFASADVFVMPNIPVDGDVEGFGLVALEAAVTGLPVVAADLEGIRDAITNGINGWLLPAGDAGAFGGTIARLASDSSERLRFGQGASAYTSSQCSWGIMAESYIALYGELSGGQGGKRCQREGTMGLASKGR